MTNKFRLNPVFSGLKPSSTLYINETVNKLWQQGEQVFHMGFGESRFEVSPELQTVLQNNAHQKSYLPARGLPELTEAVANYYSNKLDTNFSSDQIIIGPGSKSLIYGLQMVLGADVFLPTPSWVSYGPQATLLGNKYFYIPSKAETNYQLEISEFDKLVKLSNNKNKMLVLNSPNNPTGQMVSAEFLSELADYCRANNILVLSDEIYFQVFNGEVEHVSISRFYPEGTFILGGLSKHFSIGGWRLGIAILPDTEFGRELMHKMVVFSSETWSGVSSAIQYAAIKAYSLEDEVEQYVADCRDIHGIRTKFFREKLVEIDVRCTRAEGAFYITANFDLYSEKLKTIGINDSSELANHLLDKYRIASLPGIDFGIPETTLSLRLSTSYLDMETAEDSRRVFDLYKSNIDAQQFMSQKNHPVISSAIATFKQFIDTLKS